MDGGKRDVIETKGPENFKLGFTMEKNGETIPIEVHALVVEEGENMKVLFIADVLDRGEVSKHKKTGTLVERRLTLIIPKEKFVVAGRNEVKI